jgi:hypothetical protein
LIVAIAIAFLLSGHRARAAAERDDDPESEGKFSIEGKKATEDATHAARGEWLEMEFPTKPETIRRLRELQRGTDLRTKIASTFARLVSIADRKLAANSNFKELERLVEDSASGDSTIKVPETIDRLRQASAKAEQRAFADALSGLMHDAVLTRRAVNAYETLSRNVSFTIAKELTPETVVASLETYSGPDLEGFVALLEKTASRAHQYSRWHGESLSMDEAWKDVLGEKGLYEDWFRCRL